MSAIFQQLAPQLANAASGQAPAIKSGDVTLQQKSEAIGATSAISDPGAGSSTSMISSFPPSSSASKGANPIEELANLFIGVLSGILSEKLVRSVNSTYEVTLENVDGIGEEQFLFYLDLKRGLGMYMFFDSSTTE